MTDSVLTTFIERTHADPALARDLLDATDWNLEEAVTAYHSLYDTKTVEPEEYQYDPSKLIKMCSTLKQLNQSKQSGNMDGIVGTYYIYVPYLLVHH